MKDFSVRFSKIIDFQADGNKKKFAEITGIPYSTVVEYSKGIKKDPKLSLLTKIKNVNAEWLLRGIGDPLLKKGANLNHQIDGLIEDVRKQDERLTVVELKMDALNVLLLKQAASEPDKS